MSRPRPVRPQVLYANSPLIGAPCHLCGKRLAAGNDVVTTILPGFQGATYAHLKCQQLAMATSPDNGS
jgi:hypothetical protein